MTDALDWEGTAAERTITLSRARTGGRTCTCSHCACTGSQSGSVPMSGATDSTVPPGLTAGLSLPLRLLERLSTWLPVATSCSCGRGRSRRQDRCRHCASSGHTEVDYRMVGGPVAHICCRQRQAATHVAGKGLSVGPRVRLHSKEQRSTMMRQRDSDALWCCDGAPAAAR